MPAGTDRARMSKGVGGGGGFLSTASQPAASQRKFKSSVLFLGTINWQFIDRNLNTALCETS